MPSAQKAELGTTGQRDVGIKWMGLETVQRRAPILLGIQWQCGVMA
jgi:hypothetical protein